MLILVLKDHFQVLVLGCQVLVLRFCPVTLILVHVHILKNHFQVLVLEGSVLVNITDVNKDRTIGRVLFSGLGGAK